MTPAAMTTTVADIAQRIQLLRAVQVEWQRELQDAEQLEVEALAAEQKARDAQARAAATAVEARTAIRQFANELDELLSEWQALIPDQRGPT